MKLPVLIALAIFALPVSAQPTSGPSAPDPPTESAASTALNASLDVVVHYGEAVLLWEALPSADGYVVEARAPGASFVEVARVPRDVAAELSGYSVRLDLPDGRYAVRLVALETDAVTATRNLTLEALGPFVEDNVSGPESLLAMN